MNSASTFGKELLRIAPSDIRIPKRLGLYFPDKAAALGRLMAIHGQRTPITVRKTLRQAQGERVQPWTLVTGMHRLNGALIEELPEVFALERIGGTAADALDEEASENLDRRDQPPLERAIFIHATCEAARARLAAEHGELSYQKLGAKARWDRVKAGEIPPEQALQEEGDDACANMAQAYGWADSVADAFGRGKRDIYRSLRLYRQIAEPFPHYTQALSDHPVVGSNQKELLDLAKLESWAERLAVIEALLSDRELSVEGARVQVGIAKASGPGATPLPKDKHLNAIVGGWSHLNTTDRRRFIDEQMLTLFSTRDLMVRARDRLDAEIAKGNSDCG